MSLPPYLRASLNAPAGNDSAGPTASRLEQHLAKGFYPLEDYANDFVTLPRALDRVGRLRLDESCGGDEVRSLVGQIRTLLRSVKAGTGTELATQNADLSARIGAGHENAEALRVQQLTLLNRVFATLRPAGLKQLSDHADALEAALGHYAFHAHELVDRTLRESIAETAARLRYFKRLE